MSDIFDKVAQNHDWFKKLGDKIPGFKGLIERGDRRMADKILREQIANDYEAQYQRLSGIQRDLISQGGIEYMAKLENAALKIRQFIDRIRNASYGYAGVFDAVKVNEEELAQGYEYDAYLYSLKDSVERALDNLEASIGGEGLDASIRNLTAVVQGVLDALNKRSDHFKGLENKAS